MAQEEADAAVFADAAARPAEDEWPEWGGVYRRAWTALRDDRHYGAFGGAGRIWFAALEVFARRYRIAGADFDLLLEGLRALDDEYLLWVEKQARETKP